jgi:uncharacterized protein
METSTKKKRVVLVWDAPNLDMALSAILGNKPTPSDRPNFNALAKWLVNRASALDATAEGTVYTNVVRGAEDRIRPWIDALRIIGFSVFALPKVNNSDVDDNMVAALESAIAAGDVVELLIASGDRRAFDDVAARAIAAGISVNYLGFREFSAGVVSIPFIDLDEVEGMLSATLHRVSLTNLPDEGAILAPTGRLGEGNDPTRTVVSHGTAEQSVTAL